MKEDRKFAVYLPQTYGGSLVRYPVLYILDGNWNFHFVSGLVKQLTGSGDIPPMVVIGIYQVNRNRELTPAGPNGPQGNFGGAN